MKKHLLFTLSSFLFLLLSFNVQAQEAAKASTLEAGRTKVDLKPTYEQFNDQCILDKIEYREDRTIFHFRYKASTYSSIWLYSPEGAHPWFLKDNINNKEYSLIGVYNVRRNNKRTHEEIKEPYVYMNADYEKEKTYFECEVHFERLPENVSKVDLIEGKGMEAAWNHFHCFDIQIRPFSLKEEKEEPLVAPVEMIEIPTLVIETPIQIQECRCLQDVGPIINVVNAEIEEAEIPVEIEEVEVPVEKANSNLTEIEKNEDWSVFPTPATNVLNVKQTENQTAQLTLLNINGQVIWTGRMQGTTTTIDISELSTGAYFLQRTVAGTSSSQKVLIK